MLKETGTGIYIAYSRSETLQVANTSPVALVNCRHTKVGFATDSFLASAENCRKDFGNRLKFIPLLEVSPRDIPGLQKNILALLDRRFSRVGAASNWFDTQDRQAIITLIYSLLSTAANDPGESDEELRG